MSSATAISVSARSVTLPAKRMWCAENPYQGGGSTATVPGRLSAAASDTEWASIVSVPSGMWLPCCSTEPSGRISTVLSRSSAPTSGEVSSSKRIISPRRLRS